MSTPSPSAVRYREWALYASIFIAAFVLRWIHIDASSLWQDEVLQLQRTTLSFAEIWRHSPPDKPPFDYFIQSVLIGNLPGEAQARLHACLFGAGFVVAMTAWGRMAGGSSLAVIVFLLTLASPFHVRFSQEGRAYSLMLLADALFFLTLLRLERHRPDRRWWIALTGVSALCIWSHYLLFFPCLTAVAAWAIFRWLSRRDPAWNDRPEVPAEKRAGFPFVAACAVALLVICSPLFGRASGAVSKQADWAFKTEGRLAFNAAEVPQYLDVFAWGSEPGQAIPLTGLALAILLIAGLTGTWRTRHRNAAWICALAALVTFGGTVALYYIFDRWIRVRYVAGSFPPMIFLAALGVDSLARKLSGTNSETAHPNRSLRAAITLALPIALLQGAYVLRQPVKRDDWRSAITHAKAIADDSAMLVVVDWHSLPSMGYYTDLLESPIPYRGVHFDPPQMMAITEQERDLWVFLTHQDWWNIERNDIAEVLDLATRMPIELHHPWGLEIRRRRSPEQLAQDRAGRFKSIPDAGISINIDFKSPGAAADSPYLGAGWFVTQPWAAERYQVNLIRNGADILLPLDHPRAVEIFLSARRSGPTPASPLSVTLVVADSAIRTWEIGETWGDFTASVPAETMSSGLNLFQLQSSQGLRVPIAVEEDRATSPSVEVRTLRLQIGPK